MSTPTPASASQTASARLDVGIDAAGERAVVGEGLDGGLGQRVHRVGADQLVDVQRVGVGRVLGRRARPTAAAGRVHPVRRAPPSGARRMPRGTAGRRACPGRRLPCRAAPSASSEPIASRRRSTSVSTRLMKKLATLATFDRSARGVGAYSLETGDVGLHHPRVAVEAEDQRDVDVASLGDHLLDRAGRPSAVAGILTIRLRRSIRSCSWRAAVSVPGPSWASAGVDLDADVAVDAVGYGRTPVEKTSQALLMSRSTSDQ